MPDRRTEAAATRLLSRISSPADLKGLSMHELSGLASEIRALIVATVSSTGGHLASSLGAVDIAVALHHVFNAPDDKVVWDVGHQAYAHKILTGRKEAFRTLRQKDGISGFPRPDESPYDAFIAGHSSTSVSAALGMAVARDLAGKDFKAIAVIGDGSLTAGLAFEGLNQAGHIKRDLLVLLNDNEMSISRNVGALSSFLSRKITGTFATRIKKEIEGFLSSIPRIGPHLMSIAKRAEDSMMTLLTPGMLFEGMGFHYVGPIDGHDIGSLVRVLEDVREVKGPVLVHAITRKGKGYGPAEEEPSLFHGVGPFDIPTGRPKAPARPTYTDAFSQALVELADKDPRVVAITAAMGEGTGLVRFAERFPDRFFDVGIAEQHALVFAAGLAKEGFIPVAAIYSTFLQRAYDQVFHDVCLQNLPVIIAMDRAGVVGADGPTHHGLFDISYLRHLPNIVVSAPKDEAELRDMLLCAPSYNVPVAIRYPRGLVMGVDAKRPAKRILPGEAEVLRQGKDVSILAIGSTVYPALDAAERLEQSGISACVVNSRFAKPLDEGLIIRLALETGRLLTVEENALAGGFGSAVLELLERQGVSCGIKRLGAPDRFIEHGTQPELRAAMGLDAKGIEMAAMELVGEARRRDKALC